MQVKARIFVSDPADAVQNLAVNIFLKQMQCAILFIVSFSVLYFMFVLSIPTC